ncbi:ferredoxin reductase [Microbacterium ulmi]|uniref:ferredoxin reductase n=1 Tax=Microbacterium ulmi TaxID=179095 RepID=UPI003133485C|nr:ferredoxin-NADP reductase [Microbacterium ulmi]
MSASWRPARVVEATLATSSARILRLAVPGWEGSLAGQHVDVRLTAEDGYQAVRSYSLGDVSTDETIEIAVDEIPEGEVSPYLVRDVQPGDEVEVLGPLGGYFVWRAGDDAPVQLIAGGSGIVPLRAMIRARLAAASGPPFRLLYSVRDPRDAIYRDELGELPEEIRVAWVYTRVAPAGWQGRVGRLDGGTLDAAAFPVADDPVVYVCGPTGFVESVAQKLVARGHPPLRIRTERFGGA